MRIAGRRYPGSSIEAAQLIAAHAVSPFHLRSLPPVYRRCNALLASIDNSVDRVPIRLYHLDGLSHVKIAATLGVPVPTVR